MRKRESWARFNFYVYAWPSMHCLYFIYARTQVKITRQWKSTLKQLRRRRQRGWQKSNRVRLARQQSCTWIAFFCAFLCCRYTSATWNCMEDGSTTTQTPEKIANLWQTRRVGIRAMKFETGCILLFFGWSFRCRRRRRCLSSPLLIVKW